MKMIKIAALAAAIAAPAIASAIPYAVTVGAKNVLLVGGSYVDASSTWRNVHDRLWIDGYKVTIVQQSHDSLDENVAATRAAIEAQDGPVVLVGHDIGGAVISIAGTSDKVKALVYVAAIQPAVGESVAQLMASKPALHNELEIGRDGRQSIKPLKFQEVYAADIPPNRTNFLSVSQPRVSPASLATPSWEAAWRTKPTYAIVATEDRIINPELQRWMYKRAGSKVTEIKASHALNLAKPEEVEDVIKKAAQAVK
ncbi:alpha/beta hydrolase [Massilia sp. RP-1-19]|uniref:Alpha/beta hydrolase n=1 Tax=Massilia polaris TaxID=2728846 RepID=A0A848HGI5_9BURK|nr:alpha/beta hydrolase [Massilia polaris]NML60996.1 alpha/beta hydrolase [Massilia polaris]